MADYDVAAVELSTPPAAASLTTYRPAIQVRNNGRFPATVTGSVSAYFAGLQVYHSPVTSAPIAPGALGLATAADDWLPETQGDFIFMGYVTTYRDQVEPNNNLHPTKVHVGPPGPPPPQPIEAHASQHEYGGTDQLDVDNLPGKLSDAQTPEAHASSHQAGNPDELNVAGLAGVLGEPQIPTDHGNEHHSSPFLLGAELTNHANAVTVHTAAANLANREISGELTGLVPSSQLILGSALPNPDEDPDAFALRADRLFGAVNPVVHAPLHESDGRDELDVTNLHGVLSNYQRARMLALTHDLVAASPASGEVILIGFILPREWQHNNIIVNCSAAGLIAARAGANQYVRFKLKQLNTVLATLDFPCALQASNNFWLDSTLVGISDTQYRAAMRISFDDTATHVTQTRVATATTLFNWAFENQECYLTAEWVNGAQSSALNSFMAFCDVRGQESLAEPE